MRRFFLFLLLFLPNIVFSQLSINYPYNRQIFQRNNNNEAQFSILGSCPITAKTILYKLTPVQEGQGVAVDWTDLQANPLGGIFQGQITAKGGWYTLHIKALADGMALDSSTISRVGVGENFIIAGQSNAQGTRKVEDDVAALDDRVNVASFSNMISSVNPAKDDFQAISQNSLEYPENAFKQLSSGAIIGPTGGTSYYWANLGDSLAQKLNVPICFFNVAWGGTSIRNWTESARGGRSENPWASGLYYPTGFPYNNLKKVAEIYGKKNGVRAVLWHNGETDSFQRMLPSVYKDYLKELIAIFRKDIGEDIPWVIAQSAFYATRYENGTCEVNYTNSIAEAQLEFLTDSNLPQLFEGPNTDSIEIPRNSDEIAYCVHFSRNYFNQVANVWFNKLTNQFFSDSKPTFANQLPMLEKQCGTDNANHIVINSPYKKINLYDANQNLVGSTKEYKNLSAGKYNLELEDSFGLKFKVPSFTLQNFTINEPLKMSLSKDSTYCEGSLSNLSVLSNHLSYQWNSGDTTSSIKLTKSGTFQVLVKDANNCTASSNPIRLTRIPKPAKPIIVPNSSTTFCDGDKVDLTATNSLGKYEWNSGEKTQKISVKNSGYVKVLAVGEFNCQSEFSDSLKITALPLPNTPEISALSDTLFCDGKSVDLLASNGAKSYLWSNGEKLDKLTIVKSGNFHVATIDSNNCLSKPSSKIYVTVWPNPVSPSIKALSDTVFCDGGLVKLMGVNGAGKYEWSSGQKSDSITIKKSGSFQLKTIDKNLCISPFSSTVYVKVNPNPSKPIIKTVGDTLICSGNSVELIATFGSNKFVWKSGETGPSIVVNKAGIFSVATIDGNNCKSEYSNAVQTKLFATPAPTSISQSSPYFLYGGLKVIDTEYNWSFNKMALTEKGVYLRVQEPGSYGIFVSKKFANGPTCVSALNEFTYKIPEDGGLTIYPNPARPNELVNIQSISSLKNATYSLYAFDGRLMASGKINEDGLYGFNVSELGEGKYFLIVNTNDHVYEKALIVAK